MQPNLANVHTIDENRSRRRFQDAEQSQKKLSHGIQKEQRATKYTDLQTTFQHLSFQRCQSFLSVSVQKRISPKSDIPGKETHDGQRNILQHQIQLRPISHRILAAHTMSHPPAIHTQTSLTGTRLAQRQAIPETVYSLAVRAVPLTANHSHNA